MSVYDPIILEKYSEEWPKLAALEIQKIQSLIPESTGWRIEHIGSTSILGLSAKPIIDLAIRVSNIEEAKVSVKPLESIGYSYWRNNPDEKHFYFVKGLPPKGKGRTHHIHFFEPIRFESYMRFRDILISDPVSAKKYEELKTELALKFKFDREAYTNAKSAFIESVLKQRQDRPI